MYNKVSLKNLIYVKNKKQIISKIIHKNKKISTNINPPQSTKDMRVHPKASKGVKGSVGAPMPGEVITKKRITINNKNTSKKIDNKFNVKNNNLNKIL